MAITVKLPPGNDHRIRGWQDIWLKSYYSVSKPVGNGRANASGDVALVQLLLNLCFQSKRLKVDGVCGWRTDNAIKHFQLEFNSRFAHQVGLAFGLKIDGVVSRADLWGYGEKSWGNYVMYTIVAMNYVAGRTTINEWLLLPFDGKTPAYLRKELLVVKEV